MYWVSQFWWIRCSGEDLSAQCTGRGCGLIWRLSRARRIMSKMAPSHGWPRGFSPHEPLHSLTRVSSPTWHLPFPRTSNPEPRAEAGSHTPSPLPSSVGYADQLWLMWQEPPQGAEDREMRFAGCHLGVWLLFQLRGCIQESHPKQLFKKVKKIKV